ncbi:MAG TPA: bifunctional adenosylcobinamide kinase/adenosylcobinamide-phosphate guanylyltransferase [Clostridia bacterium]|nr:bifunctional adenosylcobinamide kinase/adenosylcobinamide-phosphate guanylyltransferase [Clostridia bacterium]
MNGLEQDKLIFVTGGCRSGKSEFAEQLALASPDPVYYLATGVVTDEEMQERVRQHRERRPPHWQTLEEPLHLPQVAAQLKGRRGLLLVDNLSGWLTNLMYHENLHPWQWDRDKEQEALSHVQSFLQVLGEIDLHCIIVGDEVGWGLVPPTPEGRAFRDLNGKANQLVAARAGAVYLVVSGIPVKIK